MIIQKIMNLLIVTKSLAMEITFVLMMTLRNAIRMMGNPKTRMMGNPKTRMMGNPKTRMMVTMGLLLNALTVNTRVHRETAKNLCRMKVCLGVQTGHIGLPMELGVKK